MRVFFNPQNISILPHLNTRFCRDLNHCIQNRPHHTHTFFFSCIGGYWVHGPVQPPGASVWCRATGENHRRLPWSISMVRSRQEAALPTLDQASWHWTTSPARLQVVSRSDWAYKQFIESSLLTLLRAPTWDIALAVPHLAKIEWCQFYTCFLLMLFAPHENVCGY